MMRDLANNIAPVSTIDAIVGNNDTEGTGTGVDLQFFESAVALVNVGASGDTLSSSVKIDLILQDSDDDSSWSAVTDQNLVTDGTVDSSGIFATIDADGEDESVYYIGYVGGKRYLRVFADFTGTHTNGCPISATIIKGHPRHNVNADNNSSY